METWITAGRVKVNGELIASPALNVTDQDKLEIDSKPVPSIMRSRLWLYHKPRGLIVSNKDPQGRDTIFDHLPPELPHVVTVGRLDLNSEGLLLLTNDGSLARRLEHPDQGFERTYKVRAYGKLPADIQQRLAEGMVVDGIAYRPVALKIENKQAIKPSKHSNVDNHWLTLSLNEGKNREIRKLLGAFDLRVSRLIRTHYGSYYLGTLAQGAIKEVPIQINRNID